MFKKNSVYNSIEVVKQGNYLSLYFVNQGHRYLESRSDLSNPEVLPVLYNRLMSTGFLYTPKQDSLLMLGLGGGGVSNYLHRHMPNLNLDLVDIDSEVVSCAIKYFGVKEDSKQKIYISDAKKFLAGSQKKYDVILGDTYRGGYIPTELMTEEYFRLLKSHLQDEGCFVSNLHYGTKSFTLIYSRLRKVFPLHEMYSLGARHAVVLISCNNLSQKKYASWERAQDLQKKYNFYYPLTELFRKRDKLPALKP
ncbi:MAG: fused MFS/spermidine synthase [Leptospiraceae bacterium]|nr:fused MFS/spermidine synthase [Leptospiraceae bacterium]